VGERGRSFLGRKKRPTNTKQKKKRGRVIGSGGLKTKGGEETDPKKKEFGERDNRTTLGGKVPRLGEGG